MKKNYFFIVIIVMVLFFVNSTGADRKAHTGMKKHFSFIVPVEVNNTCTSIDSVKVLCFVSSKVGSGATQYRIGAGEKTFNFSGQTTLRVTARVSFNAYPGKNPLDAKWWKAKLMVRKTGSPMYYEPMTSLGVFPNCENDDSKRFRASDSGMIVQ